MWDLLATGADVWVLTLIEIFRRECSLLRVALRFRSADRKAQLRLNRQSRNAVIGIFLFVVSWIIFCVVCFR